VTWTELGCLGILWLLPACGSDLDAGSDRHRGLLPVDERSPIVLVNDGWYDNWQAEYAATLASNGRIQLAGIVVNASSGYPSVADNVRGFRELVRAARDSGMRGVPDPIASVAPVLVRPADGSVESTVPNRSEGARFIVDAAKRLSTPVHPLVVATGGVLTDLADAYLLDNTLPKRVVVIASLGSTTEAGAQLGPPNGEQDVWASWIVSSRFRYVQVNGFYDQLQEIPEARVGELPQNAWGQWLNSKRPQILDLIFACDQVSIMAAAFPAFALDVQRMSSPGAPPSDVALAAPTLAPDPNGEAWHVPRSDATLASNLFWQALGDPSTYGK